MDTIDFQASLVVCSNLWWQCGPFAREVDICVTSYSKQAQVDWHHLISSMWPQTDPIIRSTEHLLASHLALEVVVLNTKLLKDLAKLTDFCHTGKIGVPLHDAEILFKTGTFFVQRHGCKNNLRSQTKMPMLKDHKLWCSLANMLAKKGTRLAS